MGLTYDVFGRVNHRDRCVCFCNLEVGASFGRALLFADAELEASYVASTFTVTCQQTGLLAFF
eukprot:6479010-Amphidinium_carterae.1